MSTQLPTTGPSSPSSKPSVEFGSEREQQLQSPEDQDAALKSAHRKADLRLLLWYSAVYLIMRIHVGNISNTAIMNVEEGGGIKKHLGNITAQQWAFIISIFYYPYMFFEPVSTLALKRFTPRMWMSRIMITWGTISMCQGACQNYAGIMACRFFLGMAEAGFYPGVIYHLSFWYSPDTMPLRIGFFYACGMFSGTISGLLAYGISYMNGVAGLAGWRWLFILEGIPAILAAVYTYFKLPNYPETSEFLTPRERDAIVGHLPPSAPTHSANAFDWEQVKELVRDPSFTTFLLIWITHGIGGWGISLILPNIIYDLGISGSAITQVMTIPPYTLVFVILLSLSFLVQRKVLSPWVAGFALETTQIICYILLLVIKNKIGKYILVMVATASGQSFFPIIWPERIRAVRGTSAAGLAIGTTNASCQLMGILGPQLYHMKFAPLYKQSFGGSIGLLTGTLVSIVLTWYFVRRKDRAEATEAAGTADLEKRRGSDPSVQDGSSGTGLSEDEKDHREHKSGSYV